jgi:hypothetical protein
MNAGGTVNGPTGGTATGGQMPTGGASPGGSPSGGSPGDGLAGSTITQCPGSTAGYDLSLVQSMPACTLCDSARCVPSTLVPEGQRTLLATCDDTNTCVPEAYAVTGGEFLAKTCTSLEYAPGQPAEGRCISTCVPQVAEQLDRLPADTCSASERCAPCWEPIDGALTGACGMSCDTWTAGTPQVFASCGGGLGVCVPPALVPDNLKSAVPPDTCTGGWLCAPKEKARDLNYKFVSCPPSAAGLPPDPSQQGACVPQYIAAANASGGLLSDSGQCADDPGDPGAGYICAPCVNPLDGTSTGACE